MNESHNNNERPSSPWSRDSIHRFDNLADRARVGPGKYIPKPPKEELRDSHLGPGLHKIPTTYELKHSCPSFAGSVPKIPATFMGGTTRKLSSPSTEFMNTPACYDIPSSFVPRGNGLLVNHPNSSENGSACFLSPGRNDVLLGYDMIGSSSSSGGGGGRSSRKTEEGSSSCIFIKTKGRPLRPDGSGDVACLGPGRYHSPPTFLRGQLTASRKNWSQDQQRPHTSGGRPQNSNSSSYLNGGGGTGGGGFRGNSSSLSVHDYSLSRSSNSSFTTFSVSEIKENNGKGNKGSKKGNKSSNHHRHHHHHRSHHRSHHLNESEPDNHHPPPVVQRPNQAQAQAAVELAVKLASMAASSRVVVRPNTAPSPSSSSQLHGNSFSTGTNTQSSNKQVNNNNNNNKNDNHPSSDNPNKVYISRTTSNEAPASSTSNLNRQLPHTNDTKQPTPLSPSSSLRSMKSNISHKKKSKASKKSQSKKETAQSMLEAEISTVRLLPLEGLLGPAYQ